VGIHGERVVEKSASLWKRESPLLRALKVEPRGLEPLTYWLPASRSPS
jgi:hypothetical protein